MSQTHPFTQLDVFTAEALLGNPLAIVHEADTVSDERMAALARWTNLSETTFLLTPRAPDADYRVRIFTPGGELPFAGHPTLGSCRAWLMAGGHPKRDGEIVQECGIGLVRIRRDGERLAFAAPPTRTAPAEDSTLKAVCAALGLRREQVQAAAWLDNGPRWFTLRLDSARTVLAIEPDHSALKSLPKVGVAGPYPRGAGTDVEVRAFAASVGVPEDPVTGSLNASLAQWLIGGGILQPTYEATQGARLGRAGRVFVTFDGHTYWIGGHVASCVAGTIRL